MTKLEELILAKRKAIEEAAKKQRLAELERVNTLDRKIRAMQFWNDLGISGIPNFIATNNDTRDIRYATEFTVNTLPCTIIITVSENYYTHVWLSYNGDYHFGLSTINDADKYLVDSVARCLK